ncbi:carbon starvation CstA family protein [Bacillus velezensis]
MNAITIVIASICILAIAYRLYGTFMMVKVLKINDQTPTPAHVLEDGKDYVPTNKWVSFGHHFAAIAAAYPLVGPILAAQFGYLPGLLWLLIGAVIGEPCTILSYCLHQCGKTGKRFLKSPKKSSARWRAFAPDLSMLFIITITMAGLSMVVLHALEKTRGERLRWGLRFRSRWGSASTIKNGQSQTRINSRVSFVNG